MSSLTPIPTSQPIWSNLKNRTTSLNSICVKVLKTTANAENELVETIIITIGGYVNMVLKIPYIRNFPVPTCM